MIYLYGFIYMMLATFSGLIFKYIFMYLYLFLTGKSTILLIDYLRKKKLKEEYLLYTKIESFNWNNFHW